MAVKPIPDGYPRVVPHLQVRGAGDAVEFYKKAFGAREVMRMPAPDGRLAHAEIRIGDAPIFLVDEFPEMGPKCSPTSLGGSSVSIHLWCEDADAAFKRAIDAGCQVMMQIDDMFWGDRYGVVTDPFGHNWSIATHKKDLTPEQMMDAMKTAMGPQGQVS